MTTTERLRAVLLLVLVAVVLTACGNDGAPGAGDEPGGTSGSGGANEPSDPASTVVPPPADLTTQVTVGPDAVAVDLTYTNTGSVPVLLVGAPTSGGPAYVTGQDDGVVVSRRAFTTPDPSKVDFAQAPRVEVVEVAPGEQVSDTFSVPRPLVRQQPWGDDLGFGTITLPDPATTVTFCLGVIPSPYDPAIGLERDDDETTIAHGRVTAESQAVSCSDPEPLT